MSTRFNVILSSDCLNTETGENKGSDAHFSFKSEEVFEFHESTFFGISNLQSLLRLPH